MVNSQNWAGTCIVAFRLSKLAILPIELYFVQTSWYLTDIALKIKENVKRSDFREKKMGKWASFIRTQK